MIIKSMLTSFILFSTHLFALDSSTEKIFEPFQGYCLSTNADYKKIENYTQTLELEKAPDFIVNSLFNKNHRDTKGYFVKKNDNDILILAFSKPDQCVLVASNQTDKEVLKKAFIETFKLSFKGKQNLGVSIVEIYETTIEHYNRGVIGVIYGTTKSQQHMLTFTYTPDSTLKTY